MKNKLKYILWAVGIMAILCVALLLICNQMVVNNAKGKAFSEIDSIKYNKVGLLLGTTPQARLTKVTNYFFIYRIDAAELLYRARKIEKILISGDEHSLDGINEPECMRDSLVARGVPESAIILDGKGYRTINSIVNANKLFGLKSFTIISQQFHNERALYQAEHLGLDVENIQAYNAEMSKSRRAYLTSIREFFARVKMFWDILTDKQPEELGEEDYLGGEILRDRFKRPDFWREINTIDGHNEMDTIVGNFTGKGIDTLFVVTDTEKDDGEKWQFYAKSTNSIIPKINLWGFNCAPPKLVNEGDLDGNGTCEVGYLHTWMNSQWRYYRIFTFVNGEWRYLIDGDYLETPEWFRHSGIDIAENSGKKGMVLVHYAYEGADETDTKMIIEIKDTIVVPKFLKIDD